MTYGQRIWWTHLAGTREEVEASGYDSQEEAFRAAFNFAVNQGWTPPRWWQFWRRNDWKPEMIGRT